LAPFRLGINMAGAISAGAYTAGVLDFLIQALDDWYAARQSGQLVPPHDVSLEVLSGASAGGMCAAISTCQLQEQFAHITDASLQGTNNKFYESWVNKIDIRELLATDDLGPSASTIPSLLDSGIIADIASYAVSVSSPITRPYVSESLTLFLTVTNLRGVPYALYEEPDTPSTPDERVTYHADRVRFELVNPGSAPIAPDAQALVRGGGMPGSVPADQGWSALRNTAMATGAFPLFLASRILNRPVENYTVNAPWRSICHQASNQRQILPDWPLTPADSLATVNVDGGVTNNSPFDLACDYLATLNPQPPACKNPESALDADRAVVTVAPFPGTAAYDAAYNPATQTGLSAVAGRLITALLSQARFYGESLANIAGTPSFSRFFIAPSGPADPATQSALQCALLGAFGGFFERSFRAHDFLLGRRNCQGFLQRHFVLPATNSTLAQALNSLPADQRAKIIANYQVQPSGSSPEVQPDVPWLPVIPLCGSATASIPLPSPGQITAQSLAQIVDLIAARLNAISSVAARNFGQPLKFLLPKGIWLFLALGGGRSEISKYLTNALGDAIQK